MDTDVEICNFALVAYLGKRTISSFTEDSTEARRCAVMYPIARDLIARKSDWSFLRERAPLAEVANDRSDFWDKAYDMPSRALKFGYLFDVHMPKEPFLDYEIAAGTIYTNLANAYADYVTLEDKPVSNWSMEFKTALAAKVAELLAPSQTRKASDVERFRVLAAQELAIAIENDAAQEPHWYATDEAYVHGREGAQAPIPGEVDGSTIWR